MLNKTNIFNIPANYNFFESFFYYLTENFTADIHKIKIFLPNHRSCRAFSQLFTQKKQFSIIPQIKAISDISYEDFFDFLPELEAKETIDELLSVKLLSKNDYLFFLSKEIQKLTIFGDDLEFDQAFKIAISLQNLFEDFEREEIDFQKLDEVDDSNLSLHRQFTLDFLKKFYLQIKNSLLKENIFFTSSNQNLVIKKYTDLLNKYGTKNPIIIAGSTGSVSFGKKLIKSIINQANGHVVLYGLSEDNNFFEEENHPQFFLNQLLKFLEIKKGNISQIKVKKFLLSNEDRENFISLMMLPSQEISAWQNISSYLNIANLKEDLENNFQIIEAKNELEEAKIITLILSKNLNKISGLITNNEKLANLVKVNLRKVGLGFNDSRNIDIINSRITNFILLILELIESDFNSSTLLALLKNPLCFYSNEKEILSDFESNVLRKDRSTPGLNGIKDKLKSLAKDDLNKFFQNFLQDIFPVTNISNKVILADYLDALIMVIEKLTKKSWIDLLLCEPAQVELFKFFENLKLQNTLEINRKNSLKIFQTLFSQITYFEKSDANSNIQILSPIEARLLNFDLTIISSLNEKDFPEIEADNWLGKKIKKDLGINNNLKKLGQSAYDFCNYLSNESVVLTRSRTSNGAVVIESPFLLKFKTLCKKVKINLNSGANLFLELKTLDEIGSHEIIKANPKPPIKFRHKKISITEISRLISDPYSIYAKRILQLKELEKIDFEPSYAEFGSFVHKALEEFVKNPQDVNFLNKAEKIFEQYFLSNQSKLLWWPKFQNIFSDFMAQNNQFINSKNYLEFPVKMTIENLVINGKIDRIICDEQGNLEIFDYKTGQVPSTKDVLSGTDSQLVLAALAIIENEIESHLKNIDVKKFKSLNYWKISSSQMGEIKKICDKNEKIQILISAAKEGLKKLINYFNCKENGYISAPNKEIYISNEYSHLSRVES